jgi:CheY-like chemotaxis protein
MIQPLQNIDLSKYKVLVVDDVPLNQLVVEKMLVKFGMKITKASNGLDALEKLRTEIPNLVLLDLMMPVMDGFDFLHIARSKPELASLKIIVLSALNSTEDIVRGYEAGANDFITKPIIYEKLISSIANQLRLV